MSSLFFCIHIMYKQVDAAIFAIARLGYGNIPVQVSETGWPSKGDMNEIGASIENARLYNRNLLVRQLSSEGTPLRPNQKLEVYLFALFNEDLKPGPTSERNYGLYRPDGTMAYNLGLTSLNSTSTASISLTSSASPVCKIILRHVKMYWKLKTCRSMKKTWKYQW